MYDLTYGREGGGGEGHLTYGTTHAGFQAFFAYRDLHKQAKQKDVVEDRKEHQRQKQPQAKVKVRQSLVAWGPYAMLWPGDPHCMISQQEKVTPQQLQPKRGQKVGSVKR